jgi:hypothetical protein
LDENRRLHFSRRRGGAFGFLTWAVNSGTYSRGDDRLRETEEVTRAAVASLEMGRDRCNLMICDLTPNLRGQMSIYHERPAFRIFL